MRQPQPYPHPSVRYSVNSDCHMWNIAIHHDQTPLTSLTVDCDHLVFRPSRWCGRDGRATYTWIWNMCLHATQAWMAQLWCLASCNSSPVDSGGNPVTHFEDFCMSHTVRARRSKRLSHPPPAAAAVALPPVGVPVRELQIQPSGGKHRESFPLGVIVRESSDALSRIWCTLQYRVDTLAHSLVLLISVRECYCLPKSLD